MKLHVPGIVEFVYADSRVSLWDAAAAPFPSRAPLHRMQPAMCVLRASSWKNTRGQTNSSDMSRRRSLAISHAKDGRRMCRDCISSLAKQMIINTAESYDLHNAAAKHGESHILYFWTTDNLGAHKKSALCYYETVIVFLGSIEHDRDQKSIPAHLFVLQTLQWLSSTVIDYCRLCSL